MTKEQRTKVVSTLATNCECWKGKEDVLNSLTDDQLETMIKHAAQDRVANAALKGFKDGDGNEHRFNADNMTWVSNMCAKDEEEEMDEEEEKPVGNSQQKPLTAAEWLKSAPPEIRTVVQNSMRREAEDKKKIIARMVGNIEDDAVRQRKAKLLSNKSLEELTELSELIPAPAQEDPVFNFLGSAGASERRVAYDENDCLIPPVVNYAEWAEDSRRKA